MSYLRVVFLLQKQKVHETSSHESDISWRENIYFGFYPVLIYIYKKDLSLSLSLSLSLIYLWEGMYPTIFPPAVSKQ